MNILEKILPSGRRLRKLESRLNALEIRIQSLERPAGTPRQNDNAEKQGGRKPKYRENDGNVKRKDRHDSRRRDRKIENYYQKKYAD